MSITSLERDPRQRDELLRQVAALPATIEPSRDLWPAIQARLGEEARHGAQPAPRPFLSAPWAAAAGVGIAAVSVLFTWLVLRAPADGPLVARAPLVTDSSLQAVSYGPYSRLGPEYLAVRAELSAEFQRRVAQLPPDTRAKVVQNLALIQQAATEIDAALARDPSSQLLNRLLLSTFQDELGLYTDVNAALRSPMERT